MNRRCCGSSIRTTRHSHSGRSSDQVRDLLKFFGIFHKPINHVQNKLTILYSMLQYHRKIIIITWLIDNTFHHKFWLYTIRSHAFFDIFSTIQRNYTTEYTKLLQNQNTTYCGTLSSRIYLFKMCRLLKLPNHNFQSNRSGLKSSKNNIVFLMTLKYHHKSLSSIIEKNNAVLGHNITQKINEK